MKPDLSARRGSDEFVSGQWRTRDLSPFYLLSVAGHKQTNIFPSRDKKSLSHSPKPRLSERSWMQINARPHNKASRSADSDFMAPIRWEKSGRLPNLAYANQQCQLLRSAWLPGQWKMRALPREMEITRAQAFYWCNLIGKFANLAQACLLTSPSLYLFATD